MARRHPEAEIVSGLAMVGVFAFLWARTGIIFFVFPLAFGGILPLIKGLRSVIYRFLDTPSKIQKKKLTKEEKEKQILRIAKSHNGIVTASLVALDSSMSIEEAESLLEDLTARGHASMEVNENGKVEYLFNEFRRKLTDYS